MSAIVDHPETGNGPRCVSEAGILPHVLGGNWVSASESGGCVEVRRDGERILVRNSRDPDGPVLAFTPGEWRVFIGGVRSAARPAPADAS
ncbi:DUF397 domain-containing protein [Nonomuraea sp. NPDC003727]